MATKLTLQGTVNYVKYDIGGFLAAKIIALVEQEGASDQTAPQQFSTNFIEGNGTASNIFAGKGLIEAFNMTGAKTNMQRIAVAGQRAMEENNSDIFTPKDVMEQFRSGGISSKNIARDIRKTVSQGLIYAETGKKGHFKVTEVAQQAFKEGFSQVKLNPARTTAKKSRKGGVVTKVEISEEVRKMPIQVSMDGYSDYHDYKMKGERIIWLLAFAEGHSVTELNSKEIEFLSRAVSDQIDSSAVPALTASAIKKGFLAKQENKYRVLHKGKVYLKGERGDKG